MHSDNFLACTSLMANELPERMCSGTDMPRASRSSAGLIFFGETNSVYSLPAQQRLFPCLMTWSTFRFSTQPGGTAEPAGLRWNKSLLGCAQHSHLPALGSHFSPSYPKTRFCHFPFALATAMPPSGTVCCRTVLLEYRNSIQVTIAWHTEVPAPCVMLQRHIFPFISCSYPLRHEIFIELLFVCLCFIENIMDDQSILWKMLDILKKIRKFSGYSKPKQLITLIENI